MTRKITGITLLVAGTFFAIVLLTYGGPIWPHIIGPSTLVVIGTLLLLPQRNAKS